MIDLAPVAQHLVRQTHVGQRQLATATILAGAQHPLGRQALMQRVQDAVGMECYGNKPEYTLWGDIQALKRAGLPIRYTRAAPRAGYYLPTAEQTAAEAAARLLRRIGWQPGDWTQVAVYARMAPARKVGQMLRLRRGQMRLLEARLRRERPDCSPEELARLVQTHLALLQEG